MRRTLFLIPHEILGIPVFGVGWLLGLTVLLLVLRLVVASRRGQSIGSVVRTEGMMWGALIAAIVLLLPRVELSNLDGQPVGMAIRGYGVMLLAGVSAAVALAAYRAKRRGMSPEIIYAIAPWAFFGGIIGARLFYVIQYRDQFVGDTITQTIGNMLKFTEGGLVVYGSFIGGFIAVTYYLIRHRLSWLRFGDVIIPCMFIGLALGRVGCLMNGCCYGGRCEEGGLALHFPPSSPVYQDQIRSGELLGFRYDAKTRRILAVEEGSLAEKAGIQVGSELESLADDLTAFELASREIPKEDALPGVVATIDGKRYRWGPDELPDRALPVYPAQLISSGSALLLCLVLCGLSLCRFRDGTIMMLGFAGYANLRFVLELFAWMKQGNLAQVCRYRSGLASSCLCVRWLGSFGYTTSPRHANGPATGDAW